MDDDDDQIVINSVGEIMTLQLWIIFTCCGRSSERIKQKTGEATLFCFHSENKPAIIFHLRFYGLQQQLQPSLGNSAVSHMDDEFFLSLVLSL